MKRTAAGIAAIATALALVTFSALAQKSRETIRVTLPTFDVTVNGVKYDSVNSEYPFLVYNDITYMPMTTDFAEFMGLTLGFEQFFYRHYDDYVFYVGGGERKSEVLGQYIKGTPNTSPYYEAVIPDYHIYVQQAGNEIDNQNTLYPVFNYNGITYLPLTLDIMYYRLDWEYTFNHIDGLVINSTNAVRPHDNYNQLRVRYANYATNYYYTRNCYVSFKHFLGGDDTITYATSLGTKSYSLSELSDKITYLGAIVTENGSIAMGGNYYSLTGDVFRITCVRSVADEVPKMYELKINLSTGEIISLEEFQFAQEETK